MNDNKKWSNFKPRGPNKCKNLANLTNGEKLEPSCGNHNLVRRYMGISVRDHTVCTVCVRSWNDIDEGAKEHMCVVVMVIAYVHDMLPSSSVALFSDKSVISLYVW